MIGFELLREEAMGPGQKWIQLRPAGCQTTIALVTWFDSMPPGSLQGVMQNTDDIDADVAALVGRGVKMGEIGEQPWGRFSMFTDPDGNGWILRQPPL